MRRSTYNPNCNVCSGSGRIKVVSRPKDIPSLIASILDEMIGTGPTKVCWKCRGSGLYTGYQRMR